MKFIVFVLENQVYEKLMLYLIFSLGFMLYLNTPIPYFPLHNFSFCLKNLFKIEILTGIKKHQNEFLYLITTFRENIQNQKDGEETI